MAEKYQRPDGFPDWVYSTQDEALFAKAMGFNIPMFLTNSKLNCETYVLTKQEQLLQSIKPETQDIAPAPSTDPVVLQTLGEIKKELQEVKRQRTDPTPITKTPLSYYLLCTSGVNLTRNWSGSGTSFLDPIQIVNLESGEDEAVLVAKMYPILKEKLLSTLPATYELMNGEKYKSIPPNFTNIPISFSTWLAPDLIILPKYLIQYRPPYAHAPPVPGGQSVVYGRLAHILCYPYCFILDAKVAITDAVIGEFFHYFDKPTQWMDCQMRGMLFSPDEFVLITFTKGVLSDFIHGRFTSPGTHELIVNYLSKCNLSLDTCLKDALKRLDVLVEPLATPSYESNDRDDGKSAILGCGAHGIVIEVIGQVSGSRGALKVVLGNAEKEPIVQREFQQIISLQNTEAKDCIIGAVINSHLSVRKSLGFGFDYQAYLMPTVGTPYSPYSAVSVPKEDKVLMLRSLFQIHRTRHCHGDARYVNCVKVDNKCCWLDFYNACIFGSMSAAKDFTTFLESVASLPPTERQIDQYRELVELPTFSTLDEMKLNSLFDSLIP